MTELSTQRFPFVAAGFCAFAIGCVSGSSSTAGGSSAASSGQANAGATSSGSSAGAGTTSGGKKGTSGAGTASTGSAIGSSTGGGCASSTYDGTGPVEGLILCQPLQLSATTIGPGQTLTGTATLMNVGTTPVTLMNAVGSLRPPGGTNQGGPFDVLTYSGTITVQPGATYAYSGSRPFTAQDPTGSWYAYFTFEDESSVWHDSPVDLAFSVIPSGGASSTSNGGTTSGAGTTTGSTGATTGGSSAGTDLAVDLTSPTGETVSGTLFGFGTGAFANNGFAFTGVAAIQSQAQQLVPALFRINMNAGANGVGFEDAIFANGVGAPEWQYFDPLFMNAPTWFAPNTQILLGVGSAVNQNMTASDLASWATALANRAIQDGREIFLWEVWNEPNGVIPDATYNGWFNAVADALHAVNPSYLVFGPVHSYVAGAPDTSLQDWANASGAKAGGICMHTYGFGNWTTDAELFGITDLSDQVASIRQSVAGTPAANLPIVLGEWNIDGSGQSLPQEQGIQGAIYNAINLQRALDVDDNVQFGANWEIFGDTTYGVINDPANGDYSDYRIFPPGYYLGYAGQALNGGRVQATLNVSGNLYAMAIVNGSDFAIQIVNYDTQAAQTGFTIGVQSTNGLGPNVTRWELSPANLIPAITTVASSGLATVGTSIPAEGIVILTGTLL